jgi:acetolactate synthase regulatory subunit
MLEEPMRNVVVEATLNDIHDGLIRLLGDTQRFGFGLEDLTLTSGTDAATVAITLSVPARIDPQLVATRLARHPAVRSVHAQDLDKAGSASLSPIAA